MTRKLLLRVNRNKVFSPAQMCSLEQRAMNIHDQTEHTTTCFCSFSQDIYNGVKDEFNVPISSSIMQEIFSLFGKSCSWIRKVMYTYVVVLSPRCPRTN